MIYICEKCGMLYKDDYQLDECESCECTYIRKGDERGIADIVGSLLLDSDEKVLINDKK